MRHLTDQEIFAAIESGCRTRKAVAAKLGCNRATIERRAEKSKEVKAAFDAAEADVTDIAYDKLVEAIESGAAWAIRFWLSTRDRARFSTKVKLEGTDKPTGQLVIYCSEADLKELPPHDGTRILLPHNGRETRLS